MSMFEDNNSHHEKLSIGPEATFREKHKGLLRHFKAQSRMSYTVDVRTLGTFK